MQHRENRTRKASFRLAALFVAAIVAPGCASMRSSGGSSPASSATPSAAGQPAPLTGTLAKIKNSGTIVVGHRESSPPFSYFDEKKQPVGFSMDLCNKIVDAVKTELAMPDLKVQYRMVVGNERIDRVVAGDIDIECGVTTNNFNRQKQVAFTFTTFVTGTRLIAKKKAKLEEIENLVGKKLGVSENSSNEKLLRAAIAEGKLNIAVVPYKEPSLAFAALERNEVDAVGSDDILLFGLQQKSKTPTDYEVVGRFLSYEPYALMIRKDDSAFQRLANVALANLFKSGEFNKMYQKWFSPMKVPMSEMLKAAVQVQALPD